MRYEHCKKAQRKVKTDIHQEVLALSFIQKPEALVCECGECCERSEHSYTYHITQRSFYRSECQNCKYKAANGVHCECSGRNLINSWNCSGNQVSEVRTDETSDSYEKYFIRQLLPSFLSDRIPVPCL